MSNSELYIRYPNIMRIFNEGFEDEVLSVQEDGSGEYVAYATVYGCNLVYTQDSQGFIEICAVSDYELNTLITEYTNMYAEPGYYD